ncbi:hypothetical protein B0H13DRAFT_1956878 [Mycena leptocephala]|nr:hypothetical protein B0H13DRAFT_1956878 [Mycena leptocephala]
MFTEGGACVCTASLIIYLLADPGTTPAQLTFPTQPMRGQKNGMKDAPRCATFLYFPFLFISLALPLPPSPCLCLLPLLAALSSLPCPAPSDVAPTKREDGV